MWNSRSAARRGNIGHFVERCRLQLLPGQDSINLVSCLARFVLCDDDQPWIVATCSGDGRPRTEPTHEAE